jgi:hypothetical protein
MYQTSHPLRCRRPPWDLVQLCRPPPLPRRCSGGYRPYLLVTLGQRQSVPRRWWHPGGRVGGSGGAGKGRFRDRTQAADRRKNAPKTSPKSHATPESEDSRRKGRKRPKPSFSKSGGSQSFGFGAAAATLENGDLEPFSALSARILEFKGGVRLRGRFRCIFAAICGLCPTPKAPHHPTTPPPHLRPHPTIAASARDRCWQAWMGFSRTCQVPRCEDSPHTSATRAC